MNDLERERLENYEKFFIERKSQLIEQGLSEEAAEFAMQPARLLYEQLKYDAKKKTANNDSCP